MNVENNKINKIVTSKLGTVHFTSYPKGTTIKINNIVVEQNVDNKNNKQQNAITSTTVKLYEGNYDISYELKGYENINFNIDVIPNTTIEINKNLSKTTTIGEKLPSLSSDITKPPETLTKPPETLTKPPEVPSTSISILELNNSIKSLSEQMSLFKSGIEKFIEYQTKISEQTIGKESISRGDIKKKKHINYFDRHFTIPVATASDPNDFASSSYQTVQIKEELERYADIIQVVNDGSDTLYVIISHGGSTNYSKEEFLYPGETKLYYYVYEMKFRSPTISLPYRVTEYDIDTAGHLTCATDSITICAGSTALTQLIPIEKGVIHNTALPAIGADFFGAALSPTNTPTMFRINVSVTIAGTLTIAKTRGGVPVVETLNVVPGPGLVANGLYAFDMMVHSGDSINFRYSATGGNMTLRVQEIDAAS